MPPSDVAIHQPERTEMDLIRDLAVDDRVSVEKLAALMQLHERAEARNAEKLYHAAMAEMQPRLPRVKKNGSIDLGRKPIAFAKWEDVDAVLRPILAQHGFTLSFPTRIDGDKMVMACVVSHVAGHSERSESVVSADAGPGRNAMQATGSGRKYTKRYLTLDMLNIVTEGVDDDANSADPIAEQQAMDIRDMMAALAMTPVQLDRFWAWIGPPATTPETIQSKDHERVVTWLRQRIKTGGGK